MPIVEFISGIWLPGFFISNGAAPAFATFAMNVSDERVAFVFTVPKTGTLDTFEFRVGTVTNNPDNGLRISFQNLDANGDPDGTQDQFRDIAGPFSSNTWIVPGLITSDGTDTGSKRSVTIGDRLAVVIEFVSFVAGDIIAISVIQSIGSASRQDGTEYYDDNHSGGAWTKGTLDYPLGALKYATSGYYPINGYTYPMLTINTRTYNNGSTPDEIALRFQVPWACECSGAWVRLDLDGDAEVVLYSGTTALATAVLDSSARFVTTGANVYVKWAAQALSAGTTYRIALKPTSGTNLSLYTWTADSAGLMAAAPGGVEWYRSERTDAGAWSDTTTERPFMGVFISGIQSGGGEHSAVF